MINPAEAVLRWLYPEPLHCLECGKVLRGGETSVGFCQSCLGTIHFFSGEALEWVSGLSRQYFDQVQGVALHDGMIKEWVYRVKYGGERQLVYPLVELMIRQGVQGRWDGVIPVPLHGERLTERGYNQALLIAQGLSFYLGIPWNDGLRRVKETRPQSRLRPGEREENLRNAFALQPGLEAAGKDWLIVDDIFTTGATVNELARVLKEAGARKVGVYVITSGRMM